MTDQELILLRRLAEWRVSELDAFEQGGYLGADDAAERLVLQGFLCQTVPAYEEAERREYERLKRKFREK